MPNWCQNTLIVSGNADQLKSFKESTIKWEGAECVFDMNILHPCPTPDDWYNWRIYNWGTKWNGDVYNTHQDENSLFIEFNSAWSPPSEFIKYVSRQFPDLDFTLTYMELGCFFCGKLEGSNGDFYEENCEPIAYHINMDSAEEEVEYINPLED